MSEPRPLQEVWDDLREEFRLRRLQVLAAAAYVVLLAGGLYLFSSIGEDSRAVWDVHRRTTLAAIGTGLLALGVLLSITTLVLARAVRLRPSPGRQPGVLPSRRGLVAATVGGLVLVALGVLALSRWE